MDTPHLLQALDQLSNARILVIGDIMLDKFVWGSVTRISPEAPVPVVQVKHETYAPGGAANTAMNVASLGANCYLAGLAGEDSAHDILTTLLHAKNINTQGIFTHQKPTIQKVRVMGNNHQLLRFDYEELFHNEREKEILNYVHTIIDAVDLIIVSDYAKGTITEPIMNALKKFNKKIIVDPKPNRFHLYSDVYLIKPNEKEAQEITGITTTSEESINDMGTRLTEKSNSHILLSRGKNGMSLFEREGAITHLPAHAQEACDVTGAGDTVVATLAVALATGVPLTEATILANHAAGIKVSKLGTATVTICELYKTLTQGSQKLTTRKELTNIITDLRQKNKKIVFTNGCFDILHIGHTRLLQQAKALGDVLILALDTDDSVASLKGPQRPIIPQHERAEILSALDAVDYIIFFHTTELKELIHDLKPNILVKGGDYTKETVIGNDVLDTYGGTTVILPILPGASTTNIINRIKNPVAPEGRGIL